MAWSTVSLSALSGTHRPKIRNFSSDSSVSVQVELTEELHGQRNYWSKPTMIHQYCPDIRKQSLTVMLLPMWMWKYSLWDAILLKLEVLYIVPECFSIQERLVYTETSVNNYFSDKVAWESLTRGNRLVCLSSFERRRWLLSVNSPGKEGKHKHRKCRNM